MKQAIAGQPGTSSSVQRHRGWLGLWNTFAPSKAKIHVWRLIRNGLAVGEQLHRRRIKPGVFCTACGREETIIHRFWSCPHSKLFWNILHSEKGAPAATPPGGVCSQSALAAWMLAWFSEACADARTAMVLGLYGLWLTRNEARDGKKIAEPRVIANTVGACMEQWSAANAVTAKVKPLIPRERWLPPEEGWTKANTDGATTKSGERGGGGVILRDHNGAFCAAACHFYPTTSDPEMLELLACKRAAQLAVEMNIQKLLIETDCKGLSSMLNDSKRNLSAIGPVIEDVKSLLRKRQEFQVNWVRRAANEAAHILAKKGVSEQLCKVWFQVPPDCILSVVSSEIPNYVE